jgi:hypothetical protein
MSIFLANGFGPEESLPQDEFEEAQEICSIFMDDEDEDDDFIF